MMDRWETRTESDILASMLSQDLHRLQAENTALQAEVERLRGREADLVAACRSAFEAFEYERHDYRGEDAYRCSACGHCARRMEGFPHCDDCAWVMTGKALGEWLPLAEQAEEGSTP